MSIISYIFEELNVKVLPNEQIMHDRVYAKCLKTRNKVLQSKADVQQSQYDQDQQSQQDQLNQQLQDYANKKGVDAAIESHKNQLKSEQDNNNNYQDILSYAAKKKIDISLIPSKKEETYNSKDNSELTTYANKKAIDHYFKSKDSKKEGKKK